MSAEEYINPSIQYREYWPNGKLRFIVAGVVNLQANVYSNKWIPHNIEDRPALIFFHENGNLASMHWRINGKPKRLNVEEDPTEVYYSVDGYITDIIHYDETYWQTKRTAYPIKDQVIIDKDGKTITSIKRLK